MLVGRHDRGRPACPRLAAFLSLQSEMILPFCRSAAISVMTGTDDCLGESSEYCLSRVAVDAVEAIDAEERKRG